ncbi:MAG: ABC-F family ATP-binding cassette domain-containing protein [Bacteroidetes bacterium]|nr:MAG: ABC-F family ATP-binding cassette domain-containing protein [Bacteroidota bacterium]
MLVLQNIKYSHPNKDVLFSDLSLTVNTQDKVALIGNNGTGKSTLLKLIAGELQPQQGQLSSLATPYYIPQLFGQYNHLTVAEALRIDVKLKALKAILEGDASEENFTNLNDDWTIEERCAEALAYWQIEDLDLSLKLERLSGGQKTKVFLAGLSIHQPEFILLDEPSNHLDLAGRKLLYDFIQSTKSTLVLVSHDRTLLNLVDSVAELSRHGIKIYGGNYDFYKSQKTTELNALNHDIQSKEKALRAAKEKARETQERKQKLDNRGKAKQEKAGVARIMMNKLRNSAENNSAKLKSVHAEKLDGLSHTLQELRDSVPDTDKIKFGFDASHLHKGKVLLSAEQLNYAFNEVPLWKRNLSFQIQSGERVAIKGNNGSGKTTLIKLLLGELVPQHGKLVRAPFHAVYIDQDYSLLNKELSVYQQAQIFNQSALQEHEVKIRLSRFLFSQEYWDKPCSHLSGGEKMRLSLCCLSIQAKAPDLILLDEPTNNLDIQNIEMLTAAVKAYRGTLLVVSHDQYFLEQIDIERFLSL